MYISACEGSVSSCGVLQDGDVDGLCAWMVQQIKRATREKFQLSGEKQPPVPYIFTTPQGLELDLRLFNRCVGSEGGVT